MHDEDKAHFTHEQIVVEGTAKDVHILQNMDGTKDATIRMTNVSFEEFKPKHERNYAAILGAIAEGWRGGIGFGSFMPRKDCQCVICKKQVEGDTRRMSDIPAKEREANRMIRWNDFSAPAGDRERFAHPACLMSVAHDSERWPVGLTYHVDEPSKSLLRQREALKKLVEEEGVDITDAFRSVLWYGGREPSVIGHMIDPKTYYPEIGDTIFVKTAIRETSAVIIATSDRKMSRTAFMARDVTGELLALDCANTEVTIRLMVRNGKPILQSYL